MAGHVCVGHCEIDKYADKSYRAMHSPGEDEWYAADITDVRPEDVPDADCYCFGFPCQSFSIAGKRGGFDDTRGTLFFEVMRIAKERKPRILFAENVKGLLSHDKGATFETIISTMAEMGYSVEWQVLNSKFFGVPQNRERVFIIGHLGGLSGRKVFPLGADDQETPELQGQQSVRTLITKDAEGKEPYQQDRIYDPEGISPALARGKSDLNILDESPRVGGVNMGLGEHVKPQETDVATTLMSRDYKGPTTYHKTMVMEEEE